MLQKKLKCELMSLRFDYGTEFENSKFLKFYTKNSVVHNFSTPREQQQNCVVEQKNRTLEDMARTMLIDNSLPQCYWAKVVNTACYLINRCIIRQVLNKTLRELLKGRKPNLAYLRAFGFVCYVHNNGKDALEKFDAKTDEEIFQGYSSQRKSYKVFNKRTKCVEEGAEVILMKPI